MGTVTKFLPKAERLAKEKAETLRQAVFDFDLPESVQADMLVVIQRHETGGIIANWTFNMISPAQCLEVWNAIEELPPEARPQEVDKVFKLVITHVETNTGIVTLTREELADKIGIHPDEISKAMAQLEALGAVFRERVKVPGMRGRGKARYRLNPNVGWNGNLQTRKAVAEQFALPLTVIEGGKK